MKDKELVSLFLTEINGGRNARYKLEVTENYIWFESKIIMCDPQSYEIEKYWNKICDYVKSHNTPLVYKKEDVSKNTIKVFIKYYY